MTGQKLTSHEVRDSSRLSEHLLPLQVVSASKSVGTTSRSRPTNHRLGRKLEQKLTRSSRRNPCACGRTRPRLRLQRRHGFLPQLTAAGSIPVAWSHLVRKATAGIRQAARSKPFPPKGQRQQNRRILKFNKSWRSRLRKLTALHREVMASPVFEQCTLEQLRQVNRVARSKGTAGQLSCRCCCAAGATTPSRQLRRCISSS